MRLQRAATYALLLGNIALAYFLLSAPGRGVDDYSAGRMPRTLKFRNRIRPCSTAISR